MNRTEVLQQLEQLPVQLREAGSSYYSALGRLEDAKMALRGKECELFSQGLITGKNEQAREAEVWQHTHELQRTVLRARMAADQSKVEYDYLHNRLDTIQLIAQLLLKDA
ncbi:hypothetical protein [Paenibacillus rigui]|uniref:Uncharacterized protein n=1 Tax=Paenibacillus rigui TaxID=554312 RepID=A0A229UJV4_9BACL|nr:hypothetical protein [Paenibacillus rigui]OXM83727.1 hypothetical protein CF651_24350 [Paenibacillus rigui]